MPAYKPYDTVKSTPSRKSRKGSRRTTFLANKVAGRLARKARKALRNERAAAAEAAAEELEVTE
ncbi:MAG: hypothetical protein ACREBR_05195 [bacterium]